MRHALDRLGLSLENFYLSVLAMKLKDDYREAGPCDFLFLGSAAHFSQISEDGALHSRLFEPLIDHFKLNGFSSVVFGRPPSIPPGAETVPRVYRYNRSFQKAVLMDLLLSSLGKNRYRYRSQLFEDVLRATKPLAVFSAGARGHHWKSANKLDIRFVEILHGFGYADLRTTPTFSRAETEGLPPAIISFDKISSESWVRLTGSEKGLLCVKKYWNTSSHQFGDKGNFSAAKSTIESRMSDYEFKVLVSLTSVGPFGHAQFKPLEVATGLLPGLMEAIRDSLDSTFWMLRVHPAVLRTQLPRFTRVLANLDNWTLRWPNVDWKISSEERVERLLSAATHHVTWNSMTSFEAAEKGIPTLALDQEITSEKNHYLHALRTSGNLFIQESGKSINAWVTSTPSPIPLRSWSYSADLSTLMQQILEP